MAVLEPQAGALLTGGLGLALVAVSISPAIFTTLSRFISPRKGPVYSAISGDDLYEDEDGKATEESTKAFSDKFPRISIALLTIIGFSVTLALAIITTLEGPGVYVVENWLQVGVWTCLGSQAVVLFVESSSTKRFTLGIYGCIAGLIAFLIPCLETYIAQSSSLNFDPSTTYVVLLIIQVAVGFVSACFYTFLPRRPDVFRDGKVVDRQFTVSLFGRFTYAWADKLLSFAVANRRLEIDDLPMLDHATRSVNLKARLESVKGSLALWKALIVAYWWPITLQLFITVIQSFLQFAPQIALYGILQALEARTHGLGPPWMVWIWVVALGVLMMLSSSIDALLFWLVWSLIAIPMQEQLGAVVFAKSMRRKAVKTAKKTRETITEPAQDSNLPQAPVNGKPEDEEEEEDVQKSNQTIINLVAVDARRICDTAASSYLLPGSLLKLAIAVYFLVSLLGWASTLAGLAVSVIVTPVNVYLAKKFTNAQNDLMKYRDQKVAVVTEVLQGIRQVKFSALEVPWQDKVMAIRETELAAIWRVFMYDVGLITIWIIGPLMLSAVSLAVYVILHGGLSASVAFTAIAVFSSLEMSLAVIPELLSLFLEGWVSAGRIDKYLGLSEKIENTAPADHIAFESASVAWPADDDTPEEDRFVLRKLNLKFPSKGLSLISGKTGSGKSLLLAAILGECDVLEGTLRVPRPPPLEERFDDAAHGGNWLIDSAIAFVSQTPWIENATIKDNILFGLPYHETRYDQVLYACALKKDLEMLPDGELTDIGANGINLSGGQKWRVSFARALYSRAGILILDDIFSAVDAHTGRHLYEKALTGELGIGRTRILVTHHVGLCLPRTDYSVFLEDGTAKHVGTIEELRQSDNLSSILAQDVEEGQSTENEANESNESTSDESFDSDGGALKKILSKRSRRDSVVDGQDKPKQTPKKFVEEETREVGHVKLSIYKRFFKAGGSVPFWGLVILAYTSFTALILGRSWWINIWTRSAETETNTVHQYSVMHQAISQIVVQDIEEEKHKGDPNLWLYLGVYVGLSLVACLLGSLRYYLVLSASVRSSRNLFRDLIFAILRAPLRWLDTVPVGRILNRFTADFHLLDTRVGYDIAFFAYQALQVVGIIAAAVMVSPWLIIIAAVLLGVCAFFARRYLAGAREIKRLESNAKSPIFEQFGSALAGLMTIRAFSKTDVYMQRMYRLIDRHAQSYWHLWLFNRWFSYRMNLSGAFFSMCTAAVVVALPRMGASLAGFVLSFALQYPSAIQWTVRQYTNIELDMNATERIIEYSNIETEKLDGEDVPAAWPREGKLEVENLVVGYAPDLPPVLKGLSFFVENNQRVGVVGRTGAGKSSLTLALFRFLEAREGRIWIDGIDVSKIKLHDLRSRLAIIPQDPVLFSGTIRSNLDPFNEYCDTELYDALERVHLISTGDVRQPSGVTTPAHVGGTDTPLSTGTAPSIKNTNVFTSLQSPISEGGQNLSQGQRQLLCLARAIVARPKIMVLDEATSAVDMSTDALIQRSIRAEFGRNATTLLVIAHRLSTIVDFDRILVMDAGKAVEFGSARELMDIENGVFRSLVEESGERKLLEQVIFGDNEKSAQE